MAEIVIDRVRKSYGPLTVLKDFSLHVADGEFVVLVGPSGCGKSTMLKILAGLEEATSGTIRIGGREVTDLAPGDRDIAMVFQNYALYPHLTVAANMGFGLKMRGTPAAEITRRVQEAARILDVEHLLERRPRQLSGGQRQRVALGRAIVREPQAFLMDEPLSNLDAKLRVHMRAEIGALHQRLGVTTIYVTHDQIEAMTMANRIVIMRDGEIQQIADPETMFEQPANLFVAGFHRFARHELPECRGAQWACPALRQCRAGARWRGRPADHRPPPRAYRRRSRCGDVRGPPCAGGKPRLRKIRLFRCARGQSPAPHHRAIR